MAFSNWMHGIQYNKLVWDLLMTKTGTQLGIAVTVYYFVRQRDHYDGYQLTGSASRTR